MLVEGNILTHEEAIHQLVNIEFQEMFIDNIIYGHLISNMTTPIVIQIETQALLVCAKT